MSERKIKLPVCQTRAAIGSYDADAGTVEVIWSTGAPVRRYSWERREEYDEVLSMERSAVRLDRLNAGAPLLDTHGRHSLDGVIGSVMKAEVRSGRGHATIKLSTAEKDRDRVQKIRDGIVKNVSVGYRTLRIERDPPKDDNAVAVYRVVDWEPIEISAVPVPADPGAQFRGAEDAHECTVVEPDPPADDQRAVTIRQLGSLAGEAGERLARQHIEAGTAIENFRSLLMNRLADQPTNTMRNDSMTATGNVGQHDDPTAFTRNAVAALFVTRVDPRAQMPEASRRYAYMSCADLAREALMLRGVSTTGMSTAEIIGRALGGMMTTSDFGAILGGLGERVLRERYAAVPSALRAVARQATAKDFKAKSSIQLSEAPTLEKVNEHGEFTHGSMADAKESYKVETFGRIVSLTRQAIVNDDLGAFTELSARMGLAAAEFEARFLVALLTSNSGAGPTMDDAVALFHGSHGNLASSGAAIAEATLSAGRLAMRRQTNLKGSIVSPVPKFLVVPSELETTGEKQLAAIQATVTEDTNVFAGKLSLLVEPRFTSATAWYLAADPASCPGLEYAYLAGFEGPVIETRAGFEIDGLEMKVRLDYGAGFLDHRGWYRNAGA